ncbi:MAG TPA: hypothetical protein VFF52_05280 [Isosphaeraceae bacterium]|nr:hypothetical protein [Isosphaeraceae bacterium]
MSGSGPTGLTAEFLDLVDAYCSGLIEEPELRRLEAYLLESPAARRQFAEYFHHHTELHFAVRARRAADAVLGQIGSQPKESVGRESSAGPRAGRFARIGGWGLGLAGTAAIAATLVAGLAIGRPNRASRPTSSVVGRSTGGNVAWMVNAQDCRWAPTGNRPGRDMQAGKELRLERGLAEIEFDCGARVILQGPAGLELVSGTTARLLQGTITARVPAHARGFTVLTRNHFKVVDLGTEFGLSVDETGATLLRVFTGEVAAFPLASTRPPAAGVTIRQDQTARLDGSTVASASSGTEDRQVRYVRAIEPPPVLTPRTLRLDFTGPVPGPLLDADGQGIGLTHRLPGTGDALPRHDPHLQLRPDQHALELTTTRSDINTQDRMSTGEYLGVRLADLGFTGTEDFEICATIPSIPGLKEVGQFGLYAGSSSNRNIRGGLISWPQPDTYGLFLVNNCGGRDSDLYEVGLTKTREDLRLTLRRRGGQYSLDVDNLTRRSSTTLTIAHPDFLDRETDLYVGLFGANTQSDECKTLTIRELTVTVWAASKK